MTTITTTTTTTIHSKLTRGLSLLLCVAASGACVDGDVDADAPGQDLTGETAQAIGEPACADLNPVAIYTGFVPTGGYTSPQTYDPSTCNQALAVQINNYSPLYVGAGDWGGTGVEWADAGFTAEAPCEAAWIRADLYRQVAGTWTLVGSKQANGVWTSFFGSWYCQNPGVGYGKGDSPALLVAGANYKIVSTARTSTYGTTTRKFRVTSTKDGWLK